MRDPNKGKCPGDMMSMMKRGKSLDQYKPKGRRDFSSGYVIGLCKQ